MLLLYVQSIIAANHLTTRPMDIQPMLTSPDCNTSMPYKRKIKGSRFTAEIVALGS